MKKKLVLFFGGNGRKRLTGYVTDFHNDKYLKKATVQMNCAAAFLKGNAVKHKKRKAFAGN